ncbi:MAG: hypothetical protein WDO24_02340 [Pseudomonadota bacterium]
MSALDIGSPVTPTALVAAATRMLIAATPWIALLRHHLGPTPGPTQDRAPATVSGQGEAPRA